jgi:hypothetical protein
MILAPSLLLRKKIIIEKLTKTGSISEATAKTLEEADVFNPRAFPKLTQNMVDERILGITNNKKYYLKK